MSSIERDPVRIPGPKFERGDDGKLMFLFVNDATNIIGPRPATARDKSEHAGAYRQFVASEMEAAAEDPDKGPFNGADPAAFDHDADGAPGGGPPGGIPRRRRRKQV